MRHVTPTHPTSEFRREPSFVKLVFASNGEQPEPQYRKVLDGKDSQRKETDIDVADELPSVPTAKYFDEKIQLDGVYSQDSNELDSDISAQGSQLSSLTYPLFDARSSEEINQVATPINGEETEVKSQLSIAEETDANIKTVAPTDCEDQSGKTSFFHAASKTGRNQWMILTFSAMKYFLQCKPLLSQPNVNSRMLQKSCIDLM